MNETYLGIEIGGTKLQLAVAGREGPVQETLRYRVDAGAGAEGIRRQLGEGLDRLLAAYPVTGIGAGFGGPVDSATGAIRVSHQVKGWSGFPLAAWLQERTGLPVAVDNDANTAALAEALRGAGKGFARVFYMTIGSGIGGGLVLNGSVYHGRAPGEVEVGHLRLNKEGETLESRCSGWAVNEKVLAAMAAEPGGVLAGLRNDTDNPPSALLPAALAGGDAAARRIVETLTDDLAFGLSHVVHLLHPDILILGGGLSLLGETLRGPVAARLEDFLMDAFRPAPPLSLSALGEAVVPLGAIELARSAEAALQPLKRNSL
ncbi:MAG TPA: ROK family protein [Chitinophagaceae bacterium]|jgi:glucokinase|nr:ROK family protein [Chitinophagaceae bacterium]